MGIAFKAKCRWIVISYHDPDILSLETTSPMPQLQTVHVFLAVSAGLREEVFLADLEEAFLKGKRIERLL